MRSGNGNAVNRAKALIPDQHSKLIGKIHSIISERLKATKNEVEVVAWFSKLSKMLPRRKDWVETIFNSISARIQNHSGANDDDMYLG